MGMGMGMGMQQQKQQQGQQMQAVQQEAPRVRSYGIYTPHGDHFSRRSTLYDDENTRDSEPTGPQILKTSENSRMTPFVMSGQRRQVHLPSTRRAPREAHIDASLFQNNAKPELIPRSSVKKLIIPTSRNKFETTPSVSVSLKLNAKDENTSPNVPHASKSDKSGAVAHVSDDAVTLAAKIAVPFRFDVPDGYTVRCSCGSTEIRGIEDIRLLTDQQLRNIHDLSVSHKVFGEVFWAGPLDVTEDICLEEVITFEQSQVSVYDDKSVTKPEQGHGLNRPAIVTLCNMYPKNKTTNENLSEEAISKFRKKLMKATQKSGARFLSYGEPDGRPGEWRFEVQHFSKYGLDSDSDDDDDEEDGDDDDESQGGKKKTGKGASGKKPSKQALGMIDESEDTEETDGDDEDDEDNEDDVDDDDGGGSSSSEGGKDSDMNNDALDTTNNDDSQSIHDQSFVDTPMSTGSKRPPQLHFDDFKGAPVPTYGDTSIDEDQDAFLDHDEHDSMTSHTYSHKQKHALSSTHRLVETLGLESSPFRMMKSVFSQVDVESEEQPEAMEMEIPAQLHFDAPISAITATLPKTPARHTSVGEVAPRIVPQTPAPSVHFIPVFANDDGDDVPSNKPLQSGNYTFSNLKPDAGLVLGRSFRAGWGPNGLITFSSGSKVVVEKVVTASLFRDSKQEQWHAQETKRLCEAAMAIQLSHSRVQPSKLSDLVPCPVAGEMDALHAVLGAKEQVRALSSHIANVTRDASATRLVNDNVTVWKLFDALWGAPDAAAPPLSIPTIGSLKVPAARPLHELADENVRDAMETLEYTLESTGESVRREPYQKAVSRRKYVSEWLGLQETTGAIGDVTVVDEKNADDEVSLEQIFDALTHNDIKTACDIARKIKDFRLALLIAQSTGGVKIRQSMQEQLQIWRDQGAHKFINKNRLKIFALLGGCMSWPQKGDDLRFAVCRGLDWKRSFALHLWYNCPPSASVNVGLAAYIGSFETGLLGPEGAKIAPPPHPTYTLHSTGVQPDSIGAAAVATPPQDLSFHLLKLYADASHSLSAALIPTSITPCPLDYRLCWLLYAALKAIGIPSLPKRREEQLHTEFASQLEVAGLWEYAAYVLLHLPDPSQRVCTLKELFARNISVQRDVEQDNKIKFVTTQLHVPKTWIDEALAVRARYEGDNIVLIESLINSKRWKEAHTTIVESLAADYIIKGDFEGVKRMLVPLQGKLEHIGPAWDRGGDVYLAYVNLLESVEQLKGDQLDATRRKLHLKCRRLASELCRAIKGLACSTPRDRMCKSSMAIKVLTILTEMDRFTEQSTLDADRLITPTLADLPITHTFRLCRLNNLAAGLTATIG
eukprot:m.222497 g.222497  ORF g.222497 m.222497 type:complete len:1342 (-) comp33374_c0_seq1:51-4076(-)